MSLHKKSLINKENIKRLCKENISLFSCIPYDHVENAIQYTINHWSRIITREQAIESLHNCNVEFCFMWDETEEGSLFWSKVSDAQKNINK